MEKTEEIKQNEMVEVLNGLAQASSNVYHKLNGTNGVETPDGIGERREGGYLDGFSSSVVGDVLILKYHTTVGIKELHQASFESDIEHVMGEFLKEIKKEYKKITGKTVGLSLKSDIQKTFEYLSRNRSWIKAMAIYKVGQLKGSTGAEDSKDKLNEAIRKWQKGFLDERTERRDEKIKNLDLF